MNPHVKIWLTAFLVFAGLEGAVLKLEHPTWTWVAPVLGGFAVVGAVYGLTPPSVAAKLARLAPDQAKRGLERGFIRLRLLFGLVLIAGVLFLMRVLTACTSAQLQAAGPPVGNFAACAIARLTVDEIAGMPQNKVAADIGDTCGCPQTSDPAACVATVNTILDAEAKRASMLASRVDAGR